MARYPEDLSDPELAILGELAEQAHRSVLEIDERAVRRAGRPEPVEARLGVFREIDARDADRDSRIREFGDPLRQERSLGILGPLILPPAFQFAEVVREPRDVRRVSEVGGERDENGPAVLLLRPGVHPGSPLAERRAVRLFRARLRPQLGRIGAEIVEPLVLERRERADGMLAAGLSRGFMHVPRGCGRRGSGS